MAKFLSPFTRKVQKAIRDTCRHLPETIWQLGHECVRQANEDWTQLPFHLGVFKDRLEEEFPPVPGKLIQNTIDQLDYPCYLESHPFGAKGFVYRNTKQAALDLREREEFLKIDIQAPEYDAIRWLALAVHTEVLHLQNYVLIMVGGGLWRYEGDGEKLQTTIDRRKSLNCLVPGDKTPSQKRRSMVLALVTNEPLVPSEPLVPGTQPCSSDTDVTTN